MPKKVAKTTRNWCLVALRALQALWWLQNAFTISARWRFSPEAPQHRAAVRLFDDAKSVYHSATSMAARFYKYVRQYLRGKVEECCAAP